MQGGEHELNAEVKPILCRRMTRTLSVAIDAAVALKWYHSRSQALADLAAEAMRSRLEGSGELQDMVALLNRVLTPPSK